MIVEDKKVINDSVKEGYIYLYWHLLKIKKQVHNLMPKVWYWGLVCFIDVSITILIFSYSIYYDDRLDFNIMRSCEITENTFNENTQVFLVSRSCPGDITKVSRAARITLFYCSWVMSTVLYMVTKRVNLDITFLEDKILYLIYAIRSLSFFNALDYISLMNDSKTFFRIYTVFYTDYASNLIVIGSLITSLMLSIIFYGTRTSFIFEKESKMTPCNRVLDFIVNLFTFSAIIFNLCVYLSIINTYEASFTKFLDSRGPGLQTISFMTYGTILLTIVEYHLFNRVKMSIFLNQKAILGEEGKYCYMVKNSLKLLFHPIYACCGDDVKPEKIIFFNDEEKENYLKEYEKNKSSS